MKPFLEDSSILYYCTTDNSGNYTYVNSYFKERMSYFGTEFIGKNSLDTVYKEDWDICYKTVKKCFRQPNQAHSVELRKLDQNGQVFWTAWEFRANTGIDKTIVGINCVGYDISKAKSDEEHVGELLKKTELILEKSLAGYWDLNVKKRTAITSDTFKYMLGYAPEEFNFTLDNWMALIFEDDLSILLNALQTHYASKGKEPLNVEIRYKHKEGFLIWVLCTGSVIEWDDNLDPVRLVGVHIDVTRRKEAEQNLIKKDKLFNTFINSTPDLFFLKDEKLKYVIANKALQDLYELDESQILNRTDFDILPLEVAEICKEGDERPLEHGGKIIREERDVLGKVVQTYKFPVDLGNGNIGVGTYARDITELKKTEIEKLNYQNFLRSVMDSSNEVMYIINSSYVIVDINQKALHFEKNRTNRDIIIGESIFFYLSPNLHEKYKNYYDLAFKGQFHTKEDVFNWGNGDIYFEIDFYPIFDSQKSISNIVISTRINSPNIILREKLKRDVNEKQSIANSFLVFEENERKKFAAELHDGIGQLLFASSMHFENAKTLSDQEFLKGVSLLKAARNELSNITNNELIFWSNDVTLEQAISSYIKKIDGINNISITLAMNNLQGHIDLPETVKVNYFRILQESTQNSIKHSKGTRISIKIIERTNFLTTIVLDNGVGFDKKISGAGMGISNIRNRVKIMNGRIKIITKINYGTIVAFQIPILNEHN